ncbi:MAG: sigma-54 dependent transcriptional regulator [Nitrospirae bacterium]|nr:sigma-54 dependent transcriptional regulator [Nitrospirota bacterium]
MKRKLLIVDDDEVFCRLLQRNFEGEYAVTAFSDPGKAAAYIRGNSVDVVLTDLSMPGMDGIGVLKVVKSESPGADVIIMTAYAKVESAVEAMKKGAYDYIVKPFAMDELSMQLRNLFEKRRLTEENINLRQFIGTGYRPENIIGESEAMREVRTFVERVSQTDATVLITGESGTGKELVAKAIHSSGKRKGRGFLLVHCGALPEEVLESELFGRGDGGSLPAAKERIGLFGGAEGGTLVLDEIGDMAPALQAKLLGILENRAVRRGENQPEAVSDVRVIATTNRDLGKLRREGRFREDLFFRLSVFSIRIPPLRERKGDIPLLAEHFFTQYRNEFDRQSMHLSREALDVLATYNWPGNVRELKSFFAKVCLLVDSDTISPRHLLERLPGPGEELVSYIDSGRSLGDIEKNLIRETLRKARGNMASAAKLLNISYDTLRYRMKKFGIRAETYRAGHEV